MTKRVHVSETERGNIRGQLPVKWRDRVKEYIRERGEGVLRNIEHPKGECLDRERWRLFCCSHSQVGRHRSSCRKGLMD